MMAVTPLQLQGPHARLEPLAAHHHDDLVQAVQDGELWNLWYTFIPTPDRMMAEIERRLQLQAQGSMVPFAVIEPASGQAVGMTTYMNIDPAHHRAASIRKGAQGEEQGHRDEEAQETVWT